MNRYDYVMSDRPEIAALLPDGYRTVLEIGCARGGFKSSLRPEAEVWGIEPNPAAAASASAQGYKVLVGIYDDIEAQCPNAYFDLVVCNDVIEHIANHDAFLDKIKSKLKPDGIIVGSVPNVRYFGNMFKLVMLKDWKYEEQGILDRTHVRFFTERSLDRTFREHGYRVEAMRGVNSDFKRAWTPKIVGKWILLAATIVVSLGYFRDMQYLQYGFRLSQTR